MAFYANERNESAFTAHLLWMIDHHPESPYAAMRFYSRSPNELTSQAWDKALAKYPNSPQVLFNAALFIERGNPKRALDLFARAASLTPADSVAQTGYSDAISSVYAEAVLTDLSGGDPRARVIDSNMDPDLAGKLRVELEQSSDPAFLSSVGTKLVRFRQDEVGLSLIQKAIDLEPGDPKWKEDLTSAKAEPVRRKTLHELMTGQAGRTVVIGANVAEANLIAKVQPIYPPQALRARISGTVEFTVDIGADGKIQSLQLVRGHPLLADAAKDAVLQWVYRPARLNGKPVAVTTTIDVLFTPPQK
jgi:TonB family protein